MAWAREAEKNELEGKAKADDFYILFKLFGFLGFVDSGIISAG